MAVAARKREILWLFWRVMGEGQVRKRLRRWDLGFIVVRSALSSTVELDE